MICEMFLRYFFKLCSILQTFFFFFESCAEIFMSPQNVSQSSSSTNVCRNQSTAELFDVLISLPNFVYIAYRVSSH